jgi:hypothetical protein
MKREAVHGATVEEVFDDEGDLAYRAVCLETGAVCDAWSFPSEPFFNGRSEGQAILDALSYMSCYSIHDWTGRGTDDPPTCCPAEHVMEHDRKPTSTRTRGTTK